jgi:hypothetical protein
VSDLGRVRSLKSGKPKLMKLTPRGNGYLCVQLYSAGKGRIHGVHNLVSEAFLGAKPVGMETRHVDGDPTNNALSNLHYGTPSENAQDKKVHGTYQAGELGTLTKLTTEQVEYAREAYRPRHPEFGVRALARKFGVHNSVVSRAIRGETWRGDQ